MNLNERQKETIKTNVVKEKRKRVKGWEERMNEKQMN